MISSHLFFFSAENIRKAIRVRIKTLYTCFYQLMIWLNTDFFSFYFQIQIKYIYEEKLFHLQTVRVPAVCKVKLEMNIKVLCIFEQRYFPLKH